MRSVRLFLPIMALAVAAPAQAACDAAWRLVYRHDADGKPLAGRKAALLAAIRKGDALRLAWGGRFPAAGANMTVEHAAEPVFVSITTEGEAVAQLPEHVAQASYHSAAGARFEAGGVLWRGLLTTTGLFDAIWVDRGTGRETRRVPQRAGVAWFAYAPDPACDRRAPLDLAVPGGVREAPLPPR
jgi:hypothetical protein